MRDFETIDAAVPSTRRFRGRNRFFVLAALAGLLLVSGCSPREKPDRTAGTVPVKTATAVQKDVPVEIRTTGIAEAFAVINVTSRVDGQVVRVHFHEGQEVKKGEFLFTIDERPFAVALKAAQSNLQRDRVKLEQALKDTMRYKDLARRDYVTRTQYEQAATDAEALKAVVMADEASVDSATLNLSFCRITAPMDGRAGSLLINEGNLVKANDTRPLVVLHQLRPIYVKFSVPEQYLGQIRSQMSSDPLRMLVTAPGQDGAVRQGRLVFLENSVNVSTGTIALKGRFENERSSLWPGQFLNVVLVLGHRRDAVVIPSQAIQKGQQESTVFVVSADGTASLRKVTPGIRLDGETLVEQGLDPGETVVVDGQLRLFPGAKVAVKKEAPSTGASET